MEFQDIQNWFTEENIRQVIQEYRTLGPVMGILLPFIEAFLPFLPLVLFVVVNANAFGLFWGFLFSWIGSCVGAFVVFLAFRAIGKKKFFRIISQNKKVTKLTAWVERHGFGPLFILLCFPFTPSALVNIVAGLSHIKLYQYALAVMAGKFVMIIMMTFVGYDITAFLDQPVRTVIVLVVIFILWYVGKRVEVSLNKRVEKEQREMTSNK
ncbi:TVP38/TMEM64 family protein [Bacillus carboniphilus]|uniref:TVP38/TMEM64 family membrane protein n=1 Tax=Bacillus carboniphilus TaxID=86663 RepID=A0ABP3FBV7_9BACI